MAFADGAKAQDEPAPAVPHTRLVRVTNNARIEQGRRLERILMQEIGADQLTLSFGKHGMWIECSFHLSRTNTEQLQQIPMAPGKILEDVRQLLSHLGRHKPENTLDDVIGSRLVHRIEIAWLGRRLEGADDDACRVRPQMQCLPIEKHGMRQDGPLRSFGYDWIPRR